jgi:hypothetical protein
MTAAAARSLVQWIAENWSNQDMAHSAFRVEAFERAASIVLDDDDASPSLPLVPTIPPGRNGAAANAPSAAAPPPFVLALDIIASPGKRPVLIVVDKGTSDYSIYEIDGCCASADAITAIIAAIEREIENAGEVPDCIETDNSITFSSPELHEWLTAKGIARRSPPPSAIVEALIRQHSPEWTL